MKRAAAGVSLPLLLRWLLAEDQLPMTGVPRLVAGVSAVVLTEQQQQ